jgi:hypothetical protein
MRRLFCVLRRIQKWRPAAIDNQLELIVKSKGCTRSSAQPKGNSKIFALADIVEEVSALSVIFKKNEWDTRQIRRDGTMQAHTHQSVTASNGAPRL